MQKPFFEVFPTLQVEPELKSLLEEVQVTKASSNRARDRLRIYVSSQRLISKKKIFALERAIQDQLFPKNHLEVKIIEKFILSGQYNPQKLMDVYKDSVLEELKAYSLLEYNLLRRDRKSTRLNSSHIATSRMPSSA